MRTLDEVIAMAEHCWQPMPESLCATCPSENKASNCRLCSDILYYLKEYKKLDSLDTIAFTDDNLSLTWEELKSMGGKPVWVEYSGYTPNWEIVENTGAVRGSTGDFTGRFVETNMSILRKEEQGITWQAYRKERE